MVSVDVNGSTSRNTVQLIDEDCNFKSSSFYVGDEVDFCSDKVGTYIRETKLEGFAYHLIAVFGSQSTGKSIFTFGHEADKGTLLNRLFGTRFDVMDETQRKQTTKGTTCVIVCAKYRNLVVSCG